MPRETMFKWFNSSVRVEHPDGVTYNSKRRADGSGSDFLGVRAGVTANATFIRMVTQINERVQLAWNGASLGGSFGLRSGNDNAFAAMIEPSLSKTELSAGPVCASIGLNANTGVKFNEEGFKVGFLGFGVTMGIGGKFSFDSPFGSAGIAPTGLNNTFSRRELGPRVNVLTVDWSKELDPMRFEKERAQKRKENLRVAAFIFFPIILLYVIYNYPWILLCLLIVLNVAHI